MQTEKTFLELWCGTGNGSPLRGSTTMIRFLDDEWHPCCKCAKLKTSSGQNGMTAIGTDAIPNGGMISSPPKSHAYSFLPKEPKIHERSLRFEPPGTIYPCYIHLLCRRAPTYCSIQPLAFALLAMAMSSNR